MAIQSDTMKYFEYYTKHTYKVVLAWKDIQDILIENHIINEEEFSKINNLIIWHDNSKIDQEEFDAYAAKYYPIVSETTISSTDEINNNFKSAWEHHKKYNLHHHQTLKTYQGVDWKCYLIDMICDWIAMGWETGTLAYDYYQENKDKIDLPFEYKIFLEETLSLIINNQCYANEPFSTEKQAILVFK